MTCFKRLFFTFLKVGICVFVSCIFHAFASVLCCLVVTCLARADVLAIVGDIYCIFVTFPCCILGQVWYLIVSFPDLCRLSYYDALGSHISIMSQEEFSYLYI